MEDSSLSFVTKLCCSSILDAAREGHANCIQQRIGGRLHSRRPTSEIREAVNAHSVGDGSSPLQLSAQRGHVECVDLLIDAGADVNWQDWDGETALHKVASKEAKFDRAASCARSLIAAGANVSVKTDSEKTALHVAASNESVEVMKVLFSAKCDVDGEDCDELTALHCAAQSRVPESKDTQECIQLLLAHGASVNARSRSYWTPLVFACSNACDCGSLAERSEDVIAPVRVLLEAGADVSECKDIIHIFDIVCDGISALHSVYDPEAFDQRVEITIAVLELLIEHGVSLETINGPEERLMSFVNLSDAVTIGPIDFLRCLLRVPGMKRLINTDMLDAAVYSAFDGPEKLRVLLDAGVSANTGYGGRLALMSCAELLPSSPQFDDSVEMYYILVSNGARPCIAPDECVLDYPFDDLCLCGQSILHTAVHNGNVELVEAILKTGVDASLPCDHEFSPSRFPALITALNVSRVHGSSLVQLLLSYGADPGIVLLRAHHSIESGVLSFMKKLCPRRMDFRAMMSVLALLPIIPLRCQRHQSTECCKTLLTHISLPPSLQECCRATICSSFRVNRLHWQGLWEAVCSLPITNITKDFLLVPFGLRINSVLGD